MGVSRPGRCGTNQEKLVENGISGSDGAAVPEAEGASAGGIAVGAELADAEVVNEGGGKTVGAGLLDSGGVWLGEGVLGALLAALLAALLDTGDVNVGTGDEDAVKGSGILVGNGVGA